MHRKDLFSIAAGAVIILAVFGCTLFFTAMHTDDIIYLGRTHLLVFSRENLKFWWQPVLELWSPLTGYSFMLDQWLWGAENIKAAGHAGNILLHLLSACGFYVLLRYLKFSAFSALLAMLFWALHPQRAESVAWLAERKDCLILACGIWSLCCYVKAQQRHNKLLLALSVLLFGLSFAVKPALIGLPLILTAFLWGRYHSRKPLFYLQHTGVFWLISLGYFIYHKLNCAASVIGDGAGLPDHLTVAAWRYGMYFQKTFFPFDLNPFYPHFSFAHSSLVPLFFTGSAILVLLYFLYRANRKALYLYLPLMVCFSAAVAPALTKIGDVDFADRYSYFPSIFLVTAAAAGLCSIAKKSALSRNAVCAVSVLLVLLNGILGAQEIFVWETPESRIAASLDTPHPNYRVLTAEAVKKYQNNDFAEACEIADRLNREYMDEPASRRKAIELFCRSFEALLLFQSDRTPEGLRIMEHVLADPDWQMLIHSTYNYPRLVLLMTAQAYLKNGKRRQAAAMYQHLAHFYDRFEPMEKEFYLALSALCSADKKSALKHFENALKYSPDDQNIRRNIEMLQKETK